MQHMIHIILLQDIQYSLYYKKKEQKIRNKIIKGMNENKNKNNKKKVFDIHLISLYFYKKEKKYKEEKA